MPTVSVNVSEEMREKMKELSEKGLYQNESEYIRDALRQKIKEDTGLSPEEEEIIAERLKKMEDKDRGKNLDELSRDLGLE